MKKTRALVAVGTATYVYVQRGIAEWVNNWGRSERGGEPEQGSAKESLLPSMLSDSLQCPVRPAVRGNGSMPSKEQDDASRTNNETKREQEKARPFFHWGA